MEDIWVPGGTKARDIDPSQYSPLELLRALSLKIDQIDLIVGDMRQNHGNSLNNLGRELNIAVGRLNSLEERIKEVEKLS